MSNAWKLRILGLAAVVLVVVGIVLVVTGGDDGPSGPSTTTSTPSDGEAPKVTLPLDDTSVAGVSALGLVAAGAGAAWVFSPGGFQSVVLPQIAGAGFLFGLLLFSGTLALHAAGAVGSGAAAPAGGIALIVGWIALAASASPRRPK